MCALPGALHIHSSLAGNCYPCLKYVGEEMISFGTTLPVIINADIRKPFKNAILREMEKFLLELIVSDNALLLRQFQFFHRASI